MRYLLIGLLGFALTGCKIIEAGGVGGNQTNITGDGNTVATATKPGTMATGAGATVTEVKKSDGVAVGDGSQVASSRKGPSVAGDGNTVSQPAAPGSWWKWFLAGVALGYLAPKLVKVHTKFFQVVLT